MKKKLQYDDTENRHQFQFSVSFENAVIIFHVYILELKTRNLSNFLRIADERSPRYHPHCSHRPHTLNMINGAFLHKHKNYTKYLNMIFPFILRAVKYNVDFARTEIE